MACSPSRSVPDTSAVRILTPRSILVDGGERVLPLGILSSRRSVKQFKVVTLPGALEPADKVTARLLTGLLTVAAHTGGPWARKLHQVLGWVVGSAGENLLQSTTTCSEAPPGRATAQQQPLESRVISLTSSSPRPVILRKKRQGVISDSAQGLGEEGAKVSILLLMLHCVAE